jgi:NAD(P)-dependent dehydrogenase (short-subunit alcohol dehydrogenase family)
MADSAYGPRHGPLYDLSGLGFAPGEKVCVTGSASGIGKACALGAAKAGLAVAVWDIDGPGAQATADEITGNGGTALAMTVDVFDSAQVERAWRGTLALGACHYLVNNAGPRSVSQGPFADRLLEAVGSMETVAESWLAHCGGVAASLVNISSIAGNLQGSGNTVSAFYPAAKAGIAGLTRHMATRLDGKPRVNAVAPGITITPRIEPMLASPAMQDLAARVPVGRLGFPEDMAHAVLFLLSPAAAYINGVVLPVDGGVTLA